MPRKGTFVILDTKAKEFDVTRGNEVIDWDIISHGSRQLTKRDVVEVKRALAKTFDHTCDVEKSLLSEGYGISSINKSHIIMFYVRTGESSNNSSYLVDGKNYIQGFVCATIHRETSRINKRFNVHLLCAREKVGTMLMNFLERYAEFKYDVPLITLNALESVIGYYQKLGYKHYTDSCVYKPGISKARKVGNDEDGYRMSKCIMPKVIFKLQRERSSILNTRNNNRLTPKGFAKTPKGGYQRTKAEPMKKSVHTRWVDGKKQTHIRYKSPEQVKVRYTPYGPRPRRR